MQQQRLQQKRILHQKQVFALHLTLLNQKDLYSLIKKKIQENPFIQADFLHDISISKPQYSSTSDFISNTLSAQDTWKEELQHEIRCMPYDQKTLFLLRCLIDSLDDQGILQYPHLEKIQSEYNFLQASITRWAQALQKLRLFGEPGFASFSKERFLLCRAQYVAQQQGLSEESFRILQQLQEKSLSQFLHNLQYHNHYYQRCEILGFIAKELPGSNANTETAYIQADAQISEQEQQIQVKLLGIQEHSCTLKQPTHTLSPHRKKLWDRALSFLQALTFRHKTLLSVISTLAHYQKRYLLGQRDHPQALTQEQLATELQIAPSTISRTIHEKFVQTPRGTFPIKNLFPGVLTQQHGYSISHFRVEKVLQKIIQTENLTQPLSDKKIQNILQQEYDIQLARRTITKYRLLLGIPNSRQRKCLL